MKKNWIAVVLAAVIASSCLAGCGSSNAQKTEDAAKAVTEETAVEVQEADEGTTLAADDLDFSANPVTEFAGPYMDEKGADYYLNVDTTDAENGAYVEIYTNVDEYSYAYWEMYGVYDKAAGTIKYSEGVKGIMKEDQTTGEFSEEDVYADGSGVFTVKDGKITWKDDKEDAGKDLVFVWDQETADVMKQMEAEGEYSDGAQNPLMNWTGPYQAENDANVSMFIESGAEGSSDGEITITKVEGNKKTEWMMTGTFHEETMSIDYTGCVKSEYDFENEQETGEQKVIYEDGTGKLVITETDEESYISWTDDKENAGEGLKFVFSFDMYEEGDTAAAASEEFVPDEDEDVEEVGDLSDLDFEFEEDEEE